MYNFNEYKTAVKHYPKISRKSTLICEQRYALYILSYKIF